MATRLELTVADLMRVRVSSTLGPLAETALAYSVLRARVGAAPVRGLAQVVRQRATAADRTLASYLWLSSTVGFDVFTTGGWTTTSSEGGLVLLEAPDAVWLTETDHWAAMRVEARRRGILAPASSPTERVEATLGTGEATSWRRLLARLDSRFSSWIEPSWPKIKDLLDTEADRLAHHAATGGLEALAAALSPDVRWSGSTLELPRSGVTGTHTTVIRLRGRGLTIAPSYFALRPMVYRPTLESEPVLLIVPCASRELTLPSPATTDVPGAELLGRTRAAVLGCVARRPRTTSELSAELEIALSGASQHTAALRRAGLIVTVREGGHVKHSVTQLGENLLRRL